MFDAPPLQERLPVGGDERPEIPQWGISAKNARPVAGPGWQALPGGACRALIPGKKVRSAMGSNQPAPLDFALFRFWSQSSPGTPIEAPLIQVTIAAKAPGCGRAYFPSI